MDFELAVPWGRGSRRGGVLWMWARETRDKGLRDATAGGGERGAEGGGL